LKDVAVVAYCRTGIAKATRGALNSTHAIPMAAHVMREAVARAEIEAGEIEDGILGRGPLEGATGHNIARNAALYAGLRVGVPGITVNRHCGSGILAASMLATRLATAAWLQH
jgi:acetyl-CoA C-acetyltransferase